MAILSNNEARGDFTHVITLTYTNLQAIAGGTHPFTGSTLSTAGQMPIATIPAGGAVELCGVYEATAFAGTTSLVIDIGTTAGDPDEFIDNLDVDGMTVPVFNTGDAFTTSYTQGVKAVAAETDILLEVTDAAIGSATAGEIVVGLRILDLGRFATV